MSRIFTIFGLTGAILLAGCAAPPPLNFAPQNIEYSQDHLNAELRTISVSFPSDEKGKIRIWAAQTNVQTGSASADMRVNFKDALEEAINRSGIFKDDAETKINIYAQLTDLDIPGMGISFPTTTAVLYKIQRRSDGKFLYEKEIKAIGESAINDFAGVNRSLSAENVSYQNNISAFIEDLKRLINASDNPFNQ